MIEWFDDLALEMRFKSGEVSVTKEDILRFAAEFDPQPFHLDGGCCRENHIQRACSIRMADRGHFDAPLR
jgi:acyl dehydratase